MNRPTYRARSVRAPNQPFPRKTGGERGQGSRPQTSPQACPLAGRIGHAPNAPVRRVKRVSNVLSGDCAPGTPGGACASASLGGGLASPAAPTPSPSSNIPIAYPGASTQPGVRSRSSFWQQSQRSPC